MKITPVNGTRDYLPKEALIRDFMQSVILETYLNNGFERIMTPIIEDIENLDKSEGGENLNLIFKILKRGDKLQNAIESGSYNELADMGLRYDLTLPLSRYYANNRTKLMMPFKVIQVDKAYRAERPQKGRMRELMQCDIDIIGSTSINCEIELICTTANALLKLGIENFKVKINNRQILKSMLLKMGFEVESLDGVCIIMDKLDKIGVTGIKKELIEKRYDFNIVDTFETFLNKLPISIDDMCDYCDDENILKELDTIIKQIQELSNGKYEIEYDISLVRGQGYYTGTIFEIESKKYKGSVAGGGRYDNLIGKFLGEDIPAVGFSIGFERIFDILNESGFIVPNSKKKIVVFCDDVDFANAYKKSERMRDNYNIAIYQKPKKLGKALNRFKENGFYGFLVYGESEEISILS